MSLLSVEDALEKVVAGIAPLPAEDVALLAADGRHLAEGLTATRTQPPFDASAMDGFALRKEDAAIGKTLRVIGQSAAGHGFAGHVGPGETVRIFTGAPMPAGADLIVIQENTRHTPDEMTIIDGDLQTNHIRPAGNDFHQGAELIPAGARLGPRALTLAAAMGHATVKAVRKPHVAIIATGDELVLPGKTPSPDQIVCANPYGIAPMLERAGATVTFTGIAADTVDSLTDHFDRAADADLMITIGGASVGDHDLVGPALNARGIELDFWKIALRPGKPLMFARNGRQRILGLPGNPVSSLVCARVFARPVLDAFLGHATPQMQLSPARLTAPLPANGPRKHFMRARATFTNGEREVTPVASQDSSLLATLFSADTLIVRACHAPAAAPGDSVLCLDLDF